MPHRLVWKNRFRIMIILGMIAGEIGCGKSQDSAPDAPTPAGTCAPQTLSVAAGSTGSAMVFLPDPMSSSGDVNLAPTSSHLDDYRTSVTLNNLTGEGILKGKYIQVVNELKCNGGFGAHDLKNQFNYSHSDTHFQEAMAYYYGDIYQAHVGTTGYLQAPAPVSIVAHCEMDDNAFFARDPNNGELVCLGDSVSTPGAYYGDDAVVTVHELQHETTTDNYSPTQNLNQFWYDEAGSLNEAISDFMAMIFVNPMIPNNFAHLFDLRVFSRWALGTFDPKISHVRGANRCPAYDSNYPNCSQFPNFSIPNSTNGNTTTISYVYPDGVGWPYANNFPGGSAALQSYMKFMSQEEIHNAGIFMEGTLWDIYTGIQQNHPGDSSVNGLMLKLVMEAVRHLPLANMSNNHSPVTFIQLASNIIQYAPKITGLTAADQTAIQQALTARGLYQYPTLDASDWMAAGAGTNFIIQNTVTPGVFIIDDPEILKTWLTDISADPSIVTQTLASGINSRLDPGEVDVIWFDVQNNSDITAGGVLLTVTSSDPDVTILDDSVNIGYMTLSGQNQAQVMYGKVNGNNIVNLLKPPGSTNGMPTGNSYFKTDPYFFHTFRTAIWVKVSPQAAHGKVVNFSVKANPTNGVASTTHFPVTIN